MSLTSRQRRWILPIGAGCAALAQIAALRANWRIETESHPELQQMKVRSGYELLLEKASGQPSETVLSYSARSGHNHRFTVHMKRGRLSDQSRSLLAQVATPKEAAQLTYAPEREEAKIAGKPCLAAFKVNFSESPSVNRTPTVRLFAPLPDEPATGGGRSIHLKSDGELVVRVSLNSEDGEPGPGCRGLLTIGSWEQRIGRDLELALVAEKDSDIELTLAPGEGVGETFHSGQDTLESLALTPLHPGKLAVVAAGMTRPIESRTRMGEPLLTITNLGLGSNFLNVELSGVAGVPAAELVNGWKWPLLAGVNGALLFWIWKIFPRRYQARVPAKVEEPVHERATDRMRVFLSYSWADKERVLEIHDLIQRAGAEPWIDRDEIRGGDDWELSIKQQMRESQRVVIFVSANSVKKAGYAWAEMRMAARIAEEQPEGAGFVIPVCLDRCKLPDLLSRWNSIQLFEANGKDKLLQALGLGKSETTVPARENATHH